MGGCFCEIKRRLDDEDNNEKDDGASQPYNYHIPVSALTHLYNTRDIILRQK